MPAPLQASKKSTVTVAKRTTRSSVGGSKITSSTLQKTKNVSLGVKHGIASKNENNQSTLVKRKAEKSPISGNSLKRSAFGDITNAVEQKNALDAKKPIKKPASTVSAVNKVKLNATKPATVTSTVSRLCRESAAQITAATKRNDAKKDTNIKKTYVVHRVKGKTELTTLPAVKTSKVEVQTREEIKITTTSITTATTKPVTRQSIRLSDVAATSSSEESSLYVSALEELNITDDKQSNVASNGPPPGVEDFDKENWDDPNQMSHYAFDIFNYLKSREAKYRLIDYMPKQTSLTSVMRPLLVDWMVEVQESFELTHETLYLAVKIVDKFLSKVIINKDTLQLVGATALFIASKYEERSPPELEDIVYIGDKAYDDKNVIKMEKKILKNLDFDLGFPLSYRFLRRYARCSKAPMPLLTLARFILEYCLMEYSLITLSDSKMAAASLHIARIMTKTGGWNLTLEYYSGYKLNDFKNIAVQMNDILHKKPRSSLATVRNKYSHEIFFSVAKTPLVDNVEL